jgi:uncharacterized cupin superfamily protein
VHAKTDAVRRGALLPAAHVSPLSFDNRVGIERLGIRLERIAPGIPSRPAATSACT